jgi:hypothetical protein
MLLYKLNISGRRNLFLNTYFTHGAVDVELKGAALERFIATRLRNLKGPMEDAGITDMSMVDCIYIPWHITVTDDKKHWMPFAVTSNIPLACNSNNYLNHPG